MAKLKKHLASQEFAIELLWLNPLEDFLSQLLHLGHEFFSKQCVTYILHVLKIFFLLSWSHHGKAIFFAKVIAYQTANFILFLDSIWRSLLLSQSIFQILFGAYFIFKLILQTQSKIPNNPEKRWKILAHSFRVCILSLLSLNLQLLGQVDDKW